MQSRAQRIRVNESVVSAELDNEMVLLNVETGIYFGLDQIGTQIWSMLVAGEDEASIMDRLLSDYDVEPDQLLTDVKEFVDLLETKGLVVSRGW